jgi:hypothetical protein
LIALSDQLVNGGRAPHLYSMTALKNAETNATHQESALARWENEGGASMALAALQPVTGRPTEDMECDRFNRRPGQDWARKSPMVDTVVRADVAPRTGMDM